MRNLILSILFLFPFLVYSQNNTEKVFDYAEQMPEFPGGIDSLTKFLSHNIQWPKELGADVKPPVVVFVGFVVDSKGGVSETYLVKESYEAFNAEALRVMNLFKAIPWKPGMQSGKPVSVRYVLPIRFEAN